MNVIRFYRAIYRDNRDRIANKRSLMRDFWLYAKNRLLQPVEWNLVRRYYSVSQPIVFIIGPPRSGTTLLYQLMARYLRIAYINNFVARYWLAPLHAMLLYKRKFAGSKSNIPLESSLGGTKGLDSPHEFSYFWQFWADFQDTDDLTEQEAARIRWNHLQRELYAISNCFQRPLVVKAINYVNYNIARFQRHFPLSRFVYIRRSPKFLVQSILESRKERYGTDRVWWSTRPKNVRELQLLDPVQQVCRQVEDITTAIVRDLKDLPEKARLVVEYESLVENPEREIGRISAFLDGVAITGQEELGALRLKSGNVQRMEPAVLDVIAQLCGGQV